MITFHDFAVANNFIRPRLGARPFAGGYHGLPAAAVPSGSPTLFGKLTLSEKPR